MFNSLNRLNLYNFYFFLILLIKLKITKPKIIPNPLLIISNKVDDRFGIQACKSSKATAAIKSKVKNVSACVSLKYVKRSINVTTQK